MVTLFACAPYCSVIKRLDKLPGCWNLHISFSIREVKQSLRYWWLVIDRLCPLTLLFKEVGQFNSRKAIKVYNFIRYNLINIIRTLYGDVVFYRGPRWLLYCICALCNTKSYGKGEIFNSLGCVTHTRRYFLKRK